MIPILFGLGLIWAGYEALTNRGPHAINPAPLAAIPLFIAAGIFALSVGIAQLRERRHAPRD